MRKRSKFIIVGATINIVSGCSSSPPEMPEPKGDWVSVNTLPAPRNTSVMPLTPVTTAPVQVKRPAPAPVMAQIQNKPTTPSLLTPSALPAGITHDDSLHQFVSSGGRNQPLYSAVRSIVPGAWAVSLAPDVATRQARLSWTGGDEWPYVLRKTLDTEKLMPVIEADKHLVTVVQRNATVATTSPALAQPGVLQLTQGVQKAITTGQQKAPAVQAGSFSKPVALNLKPAAPVVLTTPLVPKPTTAPLINKTVQTVQAKQVIPKAQPAPVLPKLKEYRLESGTMLKNEFMNISSKEKCGIKNWRVEWSASGVDYSIDAPLIIHAANYEEFVTKLFTLYKTADVPLYAKEWDNCVMEITK